MQVTINIDKGTAAINTQYKSNKKLKLRIACGTDVIFHDITTTLVVPLTFGSGLYKFTLFENTTNKQYKEIANFNRRIKIDPNAYALSSNSYVKFSTNSAFYTLAKELKKIDNIYEYFINHFCYDYIYALTAASKSFTLPEIDKCFKEKKGICYNLSALFAAMARICNIPAKLVVGYANKIPHAWVEINGDKYDITAALTRNIINNYKAERYY